MPFFLRKFLIATLSMCEYPLRFMFIFFCAVTILNTLAKPVARHLYFVPRHSELSHSCSFASWSEMTSRNASRA